MEEPIFKAAAIDPVHGTLFVVSKDLPSMLRLELNPMELVGAGASPEEKGRAAFQSNCRLCHTAERTAKPSAGPSLVDVGSRLTADQIRDAVEHGRGPMPAFPKLSGAALDSLLAYLSHPERAPVASSKEAEAAPPSLPPEKLRYRSSFGFMFTRSGLPAIAPPWTRLTAYDLNQGTIKWQVPLGEVPELAVKGFKRTGSHFPKVGPVVTAGGLIFTGTRDSKVRALGFFDRQSSLGTESGNRPRGYAGGIPDRMARVHRSSCAAGDSHYQYARRPRPFAMRGSIPGAYVTFALPAPFPRR